MPVATQDANTFAPPPFEEIAGLNDAERVQRTCREGLDAARRIFHEITHDPVLVRENPREAAALMSEAGDLIGKALHGLKARADLRDARIQGVSASGEARPRDNDPLEPAFAAWAKARRKSREGTR